MHSLQTVETHDAMSSRAAARRRPVGAELLRSGVDYRVWAPGKKSVEVVIQNGDAHRTVRLQDSNGYFHALDSAGRAGDLYRFRLDGDEQLYPDPASRFQPEGPHGPSQVIDTSAFAWS